MKLPRISAFEKIPTSPPRGGMEVEDGVPSDVRLRGRRHLRLPFAMFVILTCGIVLIWRYTGKETFHLEPYVAPTSTNDSRYSHFSRPALSDAMAMDLTLNASTCAAEFPAFYPQLEENAQYWRAKGGVSQPIMDWTELSGYGGNSRILTQNGQLFLRSYRPDWQSRTRALLRLVDLSLQGNPVKEDGVMPAVDIAFSLGDKDGIDAPGWVLDKPYEHGPGQWLLPDFSFASWPEAGIPSFSEFRREAARIEDSYPWSRKSNKVFFRGDAGTYEARLDLFERTSAPGASRWADVRKTSFWENGTAPIVPAWEHCSKKYLIQAEGNSYSGRAKYIYSCRSAVIQHKLYWREHWHDALISDPASPDCNTIQVEGPNFKGLRETMLALQDEDSVPMSWNHVSTGERVAASAHRILHGRYLTPAATACYIRAAIRSYASAQVGTPPSLRSGAGVAPGSGVGDKWKEKVHGDVSYETWLQLGQPKWPPSKA